MRRGSGIHRSGLVLAAAASAVLAAGCGRSWPAVRSLADVEFLEAGGVRTVDVLPIDVGIGAADDGREPPEIIGERFTLLAEGELSSQLAMRGYHVRTYLGWDGTDRRSRAQLMSREALEATQASLASFGTAQATARDVLLTPYLPARLGEASGSDATLYVGGYAYSGVDPRGVNAGDVAKVVLIAMFIVVVVAVLVVAARKGGGGGGGGGVARAAASAGANVGRGVARAGVVAGRGLARLGRASWHLMRGWHGVDAWGRAQNHITVYAGMPAGPPPLPADGPSRTLLEVTLVDNHKGIVLWHARQEFAANPARPADVKEVVARMLGGLPSVR
jgi:hypothetical protein